MTSQSGTTDDAVARARELVLAGRYVPAVALLREHLAAHPDDGLAWHRLAGALIGVDDHAGAMDAAGRSIALNPDHPAAYRYRALAGHLLGRVRESYADAQRAVELAPDDHEALSLLAVNVLAVDRAPARCRELVRRALTANPESRAARGALEAYRRARRHQALTAAQFAALPIAVVLLLGWFAVDTGRSADARWMIWPGLTATAAFVVTGVLNRSARGALPALATVHMVGTAAAAGILTAAAGFGTTRAVTVAAGLGLVAAALSGLLSLLFSLGVRRIRAETLNGLGTNRRHVPGHVPPVSGDGRSLSR